MKNNETFYSLVAGHFCGTVYLSDTEFEAKCDSYKFIIEKAENKWIVSNAVNGWGVNCFEDFADVDVKLLSEVIEFKQSQSMADNTKEGEEKKNRDWKIEIRPLFGDVYKFSVVALNEKGEGMSRVKLEKTPSDALDAARILLDEGAEVQSPTPVPEGKDIQTMAKIFIRNSVSHRIYVEYDLQAITREIYKEIIEPLKKENETLHSLMLSGEQRGHDKAHEFYKDKIKAMQSEIDNLVKGS